MNFKHYALLALIIIFGTGGVVGIGQLLMNSGTLLPAQVSTSVTGTSTATTTVATTVTSSLLSGCMASTPAWKAIPFGSSATSTIVLEYNASVTSTRANEYMGISKGPSADYTHNAVIIRFNSKGRLEAMNGATYASVDRISYSKNVAYHFKITINVATHKYSITVTQPGGTVKTLAYNFNFRNEQNTVTSLDTFNTSAASGGQNTCNIVLTTFIGGTAPVVPPPPIATSTPPVATTTPPAVNPGPNQTLTLPTNSVTLGSTGVVAQSLVATPVYTYQWTQTSGPSTAVITGANTQTPTVSNLVAGTYTFTLTVTDISTNLSSSAQVTVVVNPQVVVQPPPPTGVGYSLALPLQDSNGWTIIPALQSGRNIYVSSSQGLDSNDGLTINTPKKTVAAGMSMLRNNIGDHLLLKAGDTWNENLGGINVSGASRTDPLVIASYGSGARPILKTGRANGMIRIGTNPASVSHIWFFDLDFYSNMRDPASPDYDVTVTDPAGVYWLTNATDISIENCRFRFFVMNIVFTTTSGGNLSDIRLRRNIDVDAYAVTPLLGHGLFTANLTDFIAEENVFDHNGWNATVPGADYYDQRHNIYTKFGTRITFRNNITSRASNYGLTMSTNVGETPYTSALVQNNLFINNGNDMVYGSNGSGLTQNITLTGNVYTETGHTISGVPQSTGITVNSANGMTLTNNYWINKPDLGPGAEFVLGSNTQQNVSFTGNTVHNWGGDSINNHSTTQTNVVISPNNIDLAPTLYVDPTRTVGSYDATIGGPGTSVDFITKARAQDRSNWNTALTANAANNYIKAGFVLR